MPNIADRAGLRQQSGQPIQHVLTVVIVTKNLAAQDTPNHHMLQDPRRIQSCGSWHDQTLPNADTNIKLLTYLTSSRFPNGFDPGSMSNG
jgi:hypothetical protein